MSSREQALEERLEHLELLVLFMQSEISTLRNLVKRSAPLDAAGEEFIREFTEQHQQQFRDLFANLPDREAVIQQIVSDYSSRIRLELDVSPDAP